MRSRIKLRRFANCSISQRSNMSNATAHKFRVGITADVLKSDGTPIFGTKVLEIFNRPDIEWEFMKPTPVIEPEQVAQYDAICAMLTRFTPQSMQTNQQRLKIIARFGVGYDSIDVPSCQKAGICLTIAPDGVRRPVAVSVITYVLMLSQKVWLKDKLTRAGRWAEKSDHIGVGLTNRVLGSIGVGNIGAEMFKLAKPFEMQLIAHDPYADPQEMAKLGVRLVELETLFQLSDFLAVNCPLNEKTKGMVNAHLIGMMKPTAFLINTARGPIVDEKALYQALKNKKIGGAGLDVFESEPTPADNPLLQLDNVIVTPHGICFTDQCLEGLAQSAFQSVIDVMEGRKPKYEVTAS